VELKACLALNIIFPTAIFENITEVRSEVCSDAASQGMLAWILKRLRAKMPFHANKLYASEMLSILLQSNNTNRQLLGELDGIDILLQQLAVRILVLMS
jgi:beta-catenin-like protein 1